MSGWRRIGTGGSLLGWRMHRYTRSTSKVHGSCTAPLVSIGQSGAQVRPVGHRWIGMQCVRPASHAMPNLVIIGSAKSGTSSLHHYLDCHPEISMAAPRGSGRMGDNDAAGKEMRFFWRDDWRERMSWYSSHFAPMTTAVRGEATPAYSAHPRHPEVPERIHSAIPNARLLYIVRDPIDRIVSALHPAARRRRAALISTAHARVRAPG